MPSLTELLLAKVAGRLLAKVEKQEHGCWLWTGATNNAGYGHMTIGGRDGYAMPAHRISYELFVGPIPEGLQIDHLCRTPRCVNPAHLEPVTHGENMRRAEYARRRTTDPLTHCKNGHPFDERNTYFRPPSKNGGQRNCRACNHQATRAYRERSTRA